MIQTMLRTGAQVLVGYLVTWLTARGLDVPEQVQTWALGAIVAGGILAWTVLVRWLETRQGATGWPVLARRIARLLMLGIATRPAYVPPNTQVEATSDRSGVAVAVMARTSRPPLR